ncbi:MAG: isoprenylcysteine carboxylmethyltransferase family protein [Synechococcales cyanobacterium CRU_2_2]|nr:isoprenylcysteine carboxylmethyltransferase family protein [Synechococcales cyanobacterium CRU_2_2]
MTASDAKLTPRKLRRLWLMRCGFNVMFFGGLLFLSAGRMDWIGAWLMMTLFGLAMVSPLFALGSQGMDVIAERLQKKHDQTMPTWDKWLIRWITVFTLLFWLVAGLGVRWYGLEQLPLQTQSLGLVLVSLAYSLFVWAIVANPFFAQGVRIQQERDHCVAHTGPYRFVRHPGYAGNILTYLAIPLLLGSPWAWVPGLGLVVLFALRTRLEDQFLQAGLPDYPRYVEQVRYRLLPGVW